MKTNLVFVIGKLLLLLLSAISAQTDKDIALIYEKWQSEYQPCKLGNEEEQIYRKEVFIENYKLIIAHNNNRENTYTLGLNQFADLTEEEFGAKMLIQSEFSVQTHDEDESSDEDEQFKDEINTEVDRDCGTETDGNFKGRFLASNPSYVDWRSKGAVTAVKNQGSCGSCWAFSTTGMLEGVNFLRGNSLTSFSEQQLLDCCGAKGYGCKGCNGAWPVKAVNYVKKYGILKSSSYPYIGYQKTCRVSIPTVNGFYVKQASYLSNSTTALKKGIAKQPVSVAVDASKWHLYSSGIFGNCSSKKSKANHAVTAVGYTPGVWIVKNSWGAKWGQLGYIYLKNGNTCGIQNYALVAKI